MLLQEEDIPRAARAPEIANLDVSALSQDDLAKLVLQRSEVIADQDRPGAAIRAWTNGDEGPLRDVVNDMGAEIAFRALAAIKAEFEALTPVLDPALVSQGARRRLADIGCGYAFFDLFAARRYGCGLALIDLEENQRRHFGFEEAGAAYSSLKVARAFLKANGVPAKDIRTLNPEEKDPLNLPSMHAAVSFLACGFHFPVTAYMPFIAQRMQPGARVIMDLRARRADVQQQELETLGEIVATPPGPNKARRVVLQRGPAE
ncbi:MAG: class I SAM-dependent methyltransferase [Sediminimonas qiaohouensis]|uniref:Class I SAM-dependent methyltransferase n=1 Tax=Sediminimonas qiaohouensis TaxID=552061 RepID=A0A7C9HBG4_9RHOB|nr:class I SAM-dependent methyltransferase [Sediminimonas qiaohouensis]MTJ05209.1 class I SAM-dependent methyltransferase [Sediminimonas qiaohouensis]